MSQAETQQPEPERIVNKQVQLIAYLSDQSYDDWREYCQNYDLDTDYFEQRVREKTNYYLYGFGEKIKIDEDQFEKFDKNDTGRINVVKETDEKKSYKNRTSNYVKSVYSTALEALLSDIDGDWKKEYSWSTSLVHKDTDAKIWASFDTRVLGMLKHRSEATEDNLFEDNKQRMAMEFRIRLDDATPELVEFFDEEFITGIINILSKSDEIGRIRVYDCETETSEKGVCLVV